MEGRVWTALHYVDPVDPVDPRDSPGVSQTRVSSTRSATFAEKVASRLSETVLFDEKRVWRSLGELWEAQGQLWEALAELWEALGELWEGLKI